MTFQLRKAERKKAKIRVGMSGPSGSGKTYSALLIAFGITNAWEKIALIDTENKSGELYSDLGPYNVITLEAPFSPERYIEAIKACEDAGMEAIIIDSASHEWDGKGGCLESNDILGQTKFKGNTWAAWSQTTPRHQKFIDAIVSSSCHIITTARSKTDTIQTEDKKVKKVGMKDIQREGFEYEFTIFFSLDRDGHHASASKDRTRIFEGKDPKVLDIDDGKKILEWYLSGAQNVDEEKVEIMRQLKRVGRQTIDLGLIKADVKELTGFELIPENFQGIVEKLKAIETKNGATAPLANQDSSSAAPHQETPAQGKDEPVSGAEQYGRTDKIGPSRIAVLRSAAKENGVAEDDETLLSYVNWTLEGDPRKSLAEITVGEMEIIIAAIGNKRAENEADA